MLDRASTFADPEILTYLKNRFIPVAIDQAYQRRQKDAEGEFYRKIAGQGPRNDFTDTTQGHYVAGPDGTLLGFSNNRGEGRIKRMIETALDRFEPKEVEIIDPGEPDARYNPHPPAGGLIIRVQAKVLGGYEETGHRWREIFQSSVSRDNLWVTKFEHDALARGEFPKSLQTRLARFHLVDNTRGEPPMWREREIRKLNIDLSEGTVNGAAHLETDLGDRGYEVRIHGTMEATAGQVTRFELIAQGDFWGEGRYTRRAPEGKFPLAILFTLADGTDIADNVPPQGSRGWVQGYLGMR